MQYDPNGADVAQWSGNQVADLGGLAARLRRLARPFLNAALQQPDLILTLREFPTDTPNWDLARSVADDSLRRALRAPEASARLTAGLQGSISQSQWEFTYNLALADLSEDASKQIRAIRIVTRKLPEDWDA
ncbi:MAG TPA: hypothetical protein VGN32_14370 [Ktedonobacterales bacterium]|jgi:hypothetical protein|nr:hypothetical protein [Ktedonobacterales bacterium]